MLFSEQLSSFSEQLFGILRAQSGHAHINYFKASLVGISEFPAIILAIHCISCQFPSKKEISLPGNFLQVEALIFA
jgi:hypothetical protein